MSGSCKKLASIQELYGVAVAQETMVQTHPLLYEPVVCSKVPKLAVVATATRPRYQTLQT